MVNKDIDKVDRAHQDFENETYLSTKKLHMAEFEEKKHLALIEQNGLRYASVLVRS